MEASYDKSFHERNTKYFGRHIINSYSLLRMKMSDILIVIYRCACQSRTELCMKNEDNLINCELTNITREETAELF